MREIIRPAELSALAVERNGQRARAYLEQRESDWLTRRDVRRIDRRVAKNDRRDRFRRGAADDESRIAVDQFEMVIVSADVEVALRIAQRREKFAHPLRVATWKISVIAGRHDRVMSH